MVIKLINDDCIKTLKQMQDNSIDLIITSPPYNLKNKGNGDVKIDSYGDKMSNDEYKKNQIEFLDECYRVLKDNGAMFYNHKNRYEKHKVISPGEWVIESKLNVKQEIIGNRKTSVDNSNYKFTPLDEKIFGLFKKESFKLKNGAQNFKNIGDIARPKPNYNMGHKATFPYELIYRIISSLDIPKDIVCLDPYMGTGTTGNVCYNLGINFIGIELLEKGVDIAKQKIYIKNDYLEDTPQVKSKYKGIKND